MAPVLLLLLRAAADFGEPCPRTLCVRTLPPAFVRSLRVISGSSRTSAERFLRATAFGLEG